MKKFMGTLAVIVAAQVLVGGSASAAYLSTNDLTVNLLPGSGLELPGDTGTVTYDLQEGVHDTITDLTGVSVDHSYIWVEVDGEPVLAVDPPMPMF